MSYSDFTLERVQRLLGLGTREADLFPHARPADVPDWLPGLLRLAEHAAVFDRPRHYIDNVGAILGVIRAICDAMAGPASSP